MKEVNNIKRGPLANCIALHDFSEIPANIKDWFEYTVYFFRDNGIEPTRISSQKTDRTVSLKIGIKQLEEIGYKADGMSIYATPPNHHSDMFDAIFTSYLTYKLGTILVICFDDQILGFNPDTIAPLAKDLSTFFGAQYGYAYQRKFSQGPSFYPYGTIGGNEDISDEEESQITKWGLVYGTPKYHLGQLRDIYPYNFLSQPHLDNQIGNLSLKAWIDTDPARGKLTQLTDSLWSWHVDPAHIEAVRESLKPTGLLICA